MTGVYAMLPVYLLESVPPRVNSAPVDVPRVKWKENILLSTAFSVIKVSKTPGFPEEAMELNARPTQNPI